MSGQILTAVLCALATVNGQTFSSVTYQADDTTNFANPERGFYHDLETSSISYSPLTASSFSGYSKQGISLILRMFYLEDFVNSSISSAYLTNINNDLTAVRTAGLKAIVRFAYTEQSTPPYGDAPLAIVLQHITQLQPLLNQYTDVIAVLQAGFIGAWGEWYYTDYFSATLGNPTTADWNNRRSVTNALLTALPSSRMIQVRTPNIKQNLVGTSSPLTLSQAFSNTAQARMGHHNDCFLSSSDDEGTYVTLPADKTYLAADTLYVPLGGETCQVSSYSKCANALSAMQSLHWSFLNTDYNTDVINGFSSGGCLAQVQTKLGYRFKLTSASLQDASAPGGEVNFTLSLVNGGWTNPYNARLVQLVLKQTTSGQEFKLQTSDDPREWSLNGTITIQVAAGLPTSMPVGSYALYLSLPAPESTLYGNPAYSIRLANVGVWNATLGYNNLNHTVSVTSGFSVPPYTGSNVFA